MSFINFGLRPSRELHEGWGLLPDPMGRCRRQQWWRKHRVEGEFFPSYDDDAFWPTVVPAAYNRIHPQLEYYEGELVFLNHFEAVPATQEQRSFLHFEAVADRCSVFLNGQLVGEHDGGHTPFNFEVTHALAETNRLMILVECKRLSDGVPGEIHDWFHEGGLHGAIRLYTLPRSFIREIALTIYLQENGQVELRLRAITANNSRDQQLTVTARLEDSECDAPTQSNAPIAQWELKTTANAWGESSVFLTRESVRLWSPEEPFLYRLTVNVGDDEWTESVGLREIRAQGASILLNGEPIILLGVCSHAADGERGLFMLSQNSAEKVVEVLKDLNCNFMRTGHQPPSRELVRCCDINGILLWSEVPAYWLPELHRPTQSYRALNALAEMVCAFRNSPAMMFWGIGNECAWHNGPEGRSNLGYFLEATDWLHEHDPSRLVIYTGGYEGAANPHLDVICPQQLADKLDAIGINSYSGINDGALGRETEFGLHYEKIEAAALSGKPVLLGEIGIDAVLGESGFDFGEQRQADYHAKVQQLFRECVQIGTLVGMTIFVLNDYKTPIKLGRFQRGYNRKGLLDVNWNPKPAYQVVKEGFSTPTLLAKQNRG